MIRLKLTEPQASIVEIHILDSAHDDDREPWWPTLEGCTLVLDETEIDRIADLFTEAANSEENEPGPCRAATALASKVRKLKNRS